MNQIIFTIDESFFLELENEIHDNLDIDLDEELFKYDNKQNFINSDFLDFIADELEINL